MMNSILLSCLMASFCHMIVDSTDVCGIKKESGPCFASIQRWHFDSESGMCRKFTYGGCRGNGNNFKSELECQSVCREIVCRLPADDGTCRGYFPSWYYDPVDGQCKEFVYGGCEGNANNFWTEEKCENVCSGIH